MEIVYFRELVIVGERLLAFTELTEGTNTSYGEYQSTIYVVVVRRVYCSGFISTTCCLDTLTGQVRVRHRHHGSAGQAYLRRCMMQIHWYQLHRVIQSAICAHIGLAEVFKTLSIWVNLDQCLRLEWTTLFWNVCM